MRHPAVPLILLLFGAAGFAPLAQGTDRQWLAGDTHVHSHWSPEYDQTQNPPSPLKGKDAVYPMLLNARMAERFGLSWMVATDHGGPNHAKLNLEEAYPELVESRRLIPGVLQFYGMELNMPAMDHHTLVMPHGEDEAATLFGIESRFDANEAWPVDPARDTEAAALAALAYMRTLPRPPLVFANHPSRSVRADQPHEFRANQDQAPGVYLGMEGAPGHQAATLGRDGSGNSGRGGRGSYTPRRPTLGGFDRMTALVGGVWDSLLGEGRRFWIVTGSDSHEHYTSGGKDFWPGEYQKTYVYAAKTYEDVLDGLRSGRIFITSGDLITALDVTASASGRSAGIGATLTASAGDRVEVTIRFHESESRNAHGEVPPVSRVDLIVGQVRGPVDNRRTDGNETTRVIARFGQADWHGPGNARVVSATLPPLSGSAYLRVRGTSTSDPEPTPDQRGEDPWADLWFYSNPVFIEVQH